MTRPHQDWHVLPHGTLAEIDAGMLTVVGHLKMPLMELPRRMTVATLVLNDLVGNMQRLGHRQLAVACGGLCRRHGIQSGADAARSGAVIELTGSTMRARWFLRLLLLAFGVCATAPVAHAQVYRCRDAAGKTIYADAPCASGGKSLTLPGEAKELRTGRTVCAQLLDERRRLSAEADRDAKRGRKESASSIKRRQALTSQYERRCVGISRSAG